MRKRVLLLAISSLLFVATSLADDKRDQVRIIEVTSATPVRDGVANEFKVEIEYTLESADEATISVGFNSHQPGRFRMSGRKKITRGTNVITLVSKVVVKDWKEQGDFMMLVNIAPYPAPQSGYRPLAGTERVIPLEP